MGYFQQDLDKGQLFLLYRNHLGTFIGHKDHNCTVSVLKYSQCVCLQDKMRGHAPLTLANHIWICAIGVQCLRAGSKTHNASVMHATKTMSTRLWFIYSRRYDPAEKQSEAKRRVSFPAR